MVTIYVLVKSGFESAVYGSILHIPSSLCRYFWWCIGCTLSPDGNTAFVADGNGGMQIIDVSNPSISKLISSIKTLGIRRISLALRRDCLCGCW